MVLVVPFYNGIGVLIWVLFYTPFGRRSALRPPFKLKPLVVTFAAGVAAGVSLYSLYRLAQTSTSSPSSPATPEPMDVQTDPTRPMQASEEHSLVEDVASVCLDAPSHAQGGEDADEDWEDLDEVGCGPYSMPWLLLMGKSCLL